MPVWPGHTTTMSTTSCSTSPPTTPRSNTLPTLWNNSPPSHDGAVDRSRAKVDRRVRTVRVGALRRRTDCPRDRSVWTISPTGSRPAPPTGQHRPLEGCTQRGESFNFVCPRSPRHGEVEMLCLLFGTCIAPRREEHRESAGLTVRHVREIGRRSLDNAAQHFGPESSQRGRVIRIDVDCSEGDRSVRRMLHDCAAFRVDRGSHHVAKAGPRSDWRGAHRPGNLLQ